MKPHRGVAILVLGILGLVMCQPLAIAAWFMADADLEKMKRGNMDASGRDLTNAGRILGIIGTVYFLVIAVLFVLFFAGIFLFRPET